MAALLAFVMQLVPLLFRSSSDCHGEGAMPPMPPVAWDGEALRWRLAH